MQQLAETWAIHNRVNLYLLEAITDEALEVSLNPKSRTVFALLAHIHNVRLMWLKAAAADLLDNLEKVEPKPTGTKAQLAEALASSGDAIERLIQRSVESGGSIKGFKPHATAFLGYLISHESHHRGQIEYSLRFTGHPLPDKIAYGMWEWGSR